MASPDRTLAASYGRFLDAHEHCGAPPRVRGTVPHAAGAPAHVAFLCPGCGARGAWTGSASASRQFLDAYRAVLRGPLH